MEAIILGEVESKHKLGQTLHYFHERGTWLDLRGPVDFDPSANFGFGVKIITASHQSDWLVMEGAEKCMVERGVVVKAKAWIGSFSLLFNCIIGEGAVVSCGAVVSNMIVPDYTMVEGNPARIVGVWREGKWKRVERIGSEV